MNYSHAYHAGSFADVFKHVVVCMILDSLQKKDTPFCYLDTHAGEGQYLLSASRSQKTKEYEAGIQLLFGAPNPPKIIKRYLQIVNRLNAKEGQYYPGSPLIARSIIRQKDRLILCELNKNYAESLKILFKKDNQVAVHCQDGYPLLKALLPPTPRRGMVLIDPPYEDIKEFSLIIKNVTIALQRWPQGIYVIWYPIKDRRRIQLFEQHLKKITKHLLMTELSLYPDDSPIALNGSGLAIINPPWQLTEGLRSILPWLLNTLDVKKSGSFRIEMCS